LLGKVYRAQGDWPAAIEALTRYTELRPDNPLGHIELAEVYEAIEAEMRDMHLADLVAALPQAAVQAPDVPLDTPYARLDGPAWRSYVAATTFSLPPNFGERPTLFIHAPSWVTYTLSLPAQPAMLRFGMGVDPQTHNWPGDGATFEVFLNGERVFLEHVDKAMARQGWHERVVDLAPWAGQEVALALAVTPGPAADTTGDWAGWGEPQVVDVRLPAMEAQGFGVQLVNEWLRAGLTAEDFIAWGEESRKAKQYEEALAWYKRAIRTEPNNQVVWLKVGEFCQLSSKTTETCWQFLANNDQNWIVDPTFAFGSSAWRFGRREGVEYEIVDDCPDLVGSKCARIAIPDVPPQHGASWSQCVRLQPGMKYRFGAWIRVQVNPGGKWRPIYYQGNVDGQPQGHWPGNQTGPMDWKQWEQTFVAPAFDDDLACFHPLRLESRGQAWFYGATLTIAGKQNLEDSNDLWRMIKDDQASPGD